MNPIAFLIIAFVLNAAANVLIKYSALHPAALRPGWPSFLQVYLNWPFIVGVVCFALNLAAYTLALRRLPLSIAYPIMVSLGYLLILGASAYLFQEKLVIRQYFGAALMLGGLWLLVR
jgi:multidrug transporter EmrE-like cation transporter